MWEWLRHYWLLTVSLEPWTVVTGWLNSKPLASHLGCYPAGTEEEPPLPVRHSPPGTGVHLFLS